MFDRFLSISLALNMRGLDNARVGNMPRLHMVLCKLILSILNVLSSEYGNVLNVSGA